MNVTNLKRNAVQKFFNLHGQYKQIILTEDGINKEFYPTCGLIFLLFICTYLTYRLAIKESFLNQLIFKFHEKLNEKQVIIEQINSLEEINSKLFINPNSKDKDVGSYKDIHSDIHMDINVDKDKDNDKVVDTLDVKNDDNDDNDGNGNGENNITSKEDVNNNSVGLRHRHNCYNNSSDDTNTTNNNNTNNNDIEFMVIT